MINRPPANLIPIGAEWLNNMPPGADWTPPAIPATQPIVEIHFRPCPGHSTQVVHYLYAEVRRGNLGTGTATNAAMRTWARQVGRPSDDAGHIMGKNQGGLGTVCWNIFPQSPNINRGVYAQAEQNMFNAANASTNNTPVRIWFRFNYGPAACRPLSFDFFIIFPDGRIMHDNLVNP